jgi:hypothetical protein
MMESAREPAASSDPIPAVSEVEARGDVARLFEDIRLVLGVPVVNLIFRHLAILPGGLAWSWGVLRPLYASGRVADAANRLGENLPLPAVTPVSRESLRHAGVDARGERAITHVLDVYNRSNAMNLVALTGLLEWLRVGAVARPASPDSEGAPRLSPGRSEAGERLPPLLAPGDMDEVTRAIVVDLNTFGERGDGHVLASMYRHLAHWPGYLGLAAGLLRPLHTTGELDRLADRALVHARDEARRLGPWTDPSDLATPTPAIRDRIEQALDAFTSNTIAKMVPIARLLRATLPAPASHGFGRE